MTRGAGDPLWAGRFSTPPAPEALALGRSLGFDVRLAPFDVAASVAHVRGLQDAGLLDAEDAATLAASLAQVGDEIGAGEFPFDDADEDIHSAIERGVTERLGDVGARLHAGRSRNDLVVTDLRLWLLAAGRRERGLTILLIRTLVARAREHAETVMAGTTHARAAQPVTLGHHLLAHAWALLRDLERADQWAERTSVSSLGAGAIATSTLGLDPKAAAERLGLHKAFENSIDAVSDRDFVLEFLADAAICGTHLSRLAADFARWTDPSLGWAELDEAYATDLAEALVRDGVPFRDAHHRTGELLKRLAADERSLRDLTPGEWEAFGVAEGGAMLDPDASVRSRGTSGGPSPASVSRQATAIESVLAGRLAGEGGS